MIAIDFETQGIEPMPNYPPMPVGLAVQRTGHGSTPGRYFAWGHPTGNNSTNDRAREELGRVLNGNELIVGHNMAFDLLVAMKHFELPAPSARINDTMILAFLLDPYGELGLKPLAHDVLGMPPSERDAVRDWLVANKIVKKNVKRWGAHISKAPGGLVGPYAIGDVDRTLKLFDKLYARVAAADMTEAYTREMLLMPMLLENSLEGIPLNMKKLAADAAHYEVVLVAVDKKLRELWRKEMGSTPPANFDSNEELADAIESSRRYQLPLTKTGRRSVSKDSVMSTLPDGKVKGLLLYRSALEKSLSTYMRPWLGQGKALRCVWNQVRDYEDDGARTGRLSSSPNMQNLTNPEKYDALLAQMRGWGLRDYTLPNLRDYIEAPRGYSLFSLDYSQQELRMLAHYEESVLADAYRSDPRLDLHRFVQNLVREKTGRELERKHIKTINFAKIYGAGRKSLAAQMGVDLDTGNRIIDAYEAALPSVKDLQDEMSSIGRSGGEIRTIGNRRYFAPPPAETDWGTIRTFEYKLLNYAIQGSSADQTKQAMVNWHSYMRTGQSSARFLMTVHDQLVGLCKTKDLKREIKLLDECMIDAFELIVPVVADPSVGKTFGNLKTWGK